MPKSSEKCKIVNFLITNAAYEAEFNNDMEDDDAVEQVFDNLYEDLSCVLSYRRGFSSQVPKSSVWRNDVLTRLDDGRFQHMLRVNRAQFAALVSLISDDIEFRKPHSCEQFSMELQLAIVLYRLGSSGENGTFKKIATTFGTGDGGTIVKVTNRVFRAILRLQKKFIYWPNEAERAEIVATTFHELPFCIGYVDGTELKLAESPVHNHATFFSRNHCYSIKAQVVCDNKLRIRNVVVGHPGSVHDARIFRNCALFRAKETFFSGSQWIAGDSAYPLSERVITPYRTNSQHMDKSNRKKFNLRHSSYRVRVEHCFGILKEKFGSLKELRMRLQNEQNHTFACNWFIVCCILHNILISDADIEEYEGTFDSEDSQETVTSTSATNQQGEIKRQALFALMFSES